MNDEKTIDVTSLSEKVKAFRVAARDILRMKMLNTRFAKIYDLNSEVSGFKKEIERSTKNLAIITYNQNKRLDEAHPDFENIQKNVEENIKSETEYTESLIKEYNVAIDNCTKKIADLEIEITEIEAGDKKVNIDEVNELTNQMIYKI